MSEIYGWLKRTERERKKLHSSSLGLPSVAVPTEEPDSPLPEEDVPLVPLVPSKPVLGRAGVFDLSAANRRVRMVLDPQTLMGEQFRVLRSKLSLMQKQSGLKTLLVTSTVPREGKTFTACGLAGVLAQEPGKRVVLIDADLRKPTAGQKIGLDGSGDTGGLAAILRGEKGLEDALFSSKTFEFCFLPAGTVPTNPSELLSSALMEQTLKSLADTFDWIVVDSPPVLALADTPLVAALCDAVVLVVQAEATATKLILEAIQRIGREKICGIVMNRTRQLHSSRYYYDYYSRKSGKQRD